MLTDRFVGSDAVTVQPYALSASVGEAAFYSEEEGCGTNSLSSISGSNVEHVKMNTIDCFLQHSGIMAVTMVKIDTEGFDLLVMHGAEKALREGVIEIVQFEYNWRWLLNHVCLRDVFDLISDKPYRLGKLVGNSIEFYDQWHLELDRFFETNYVLIRIDSKVCSLGSTFQFDGANVGVRV